MRILVYSRGNLADTPELARRWALAGHEVTLCIPAVPGLPPEEEVAGVRVVREDDAAGDGWDLVIDEVDTRPSGAARWVRDAPVVALAHQVPARRWLWRFRHVPLVVVPPGITRSRVVPAVRKETYPTLLVVGRLTPSQRPHDVLAAFELVRAEVPDARLWFVGGGPLLRVVRRIGVDGVTAWGRVDGPTRFRLMAAAHLLVVTSSQDAVVAEAAALGTPAVGAPAARHPDALAAAIVDQLPVAMASTVPRQGGSLSGRSGDDLAAAVLQAALAAASRRDGFARKAPGRVVMLTASG